MSDLFQKPLTFYANCVSWPTDRVDAPGGLVDMVASGLEISRRCFKKHVDHDLLLTLEKNLGYADHWRRGMVITQDYHVRYFRGVLHGQRVYYIVHSAIEHVFAPFMVGAEPAI